MVRGGLSVRPGLLEFAKKPALAKLAILYLEEPVQRCPDRRPALPGKPSDLGEPVVIEREMAPPSPEGHEQQQVGPVLLGCEVLCVRLIVGYPQRHPQVHAAHQRALAHSGQSGRGNSSKTVPFWVRRPSTKPSSYALIRALKRQVATYLQTVLSSRHFATWT